MRYPEIVRLLEAGSKVDIKAHGNSMTPRIASGDTVTLFPVTLAAVRKGDVVLSKVKGRYLIHLVTAVGDDGRLQISNNRGHINGWTRQVYGRVVGV